MEARLGSDKRATMERHLWVGLGSGHLAGRVRGGSGALDGERVGRHDEGNPSHVVLHLM